MLAPNSSLGASFDLKWQQMSHLHQRIRIGIIVMRDPRSAIVDMRTAKEKCAYLPQSSTDASLETGRCAPHRPFFFFWKAYLSIKQPLTAHDPIHPQVSSRPDIIGQGCSSISHSDGHNRRATTKPPHKAVIGTKTGNRKSPEKS